MQKLIALLSPALVLLLAATARSQEPTESERDVPALAPGEETATSLIVDELTHEPVPGARLTWYAEVEGLRAPALGTAVANAYGMATLDWNELATWDADGHFIVTAEGYAAAHEFGRFPPAEIELTRGRDVSARIMDLLGRPVADADVEVFLGCGHGPVLDFVTTDAEGRFTVHGQDVDEAQLWVEAPGTAADYLRLDGAEGLGAGERVLLLDPGGIAEGVILDSAGRPLEGVAVRSLQRHRGPVAMTDRRGRFRLVGVESDASLSVSHPFVVDGWTQLDGDRWRPGVPLRLRLTPWGFATETQDRVMVDVSVAGPDELGDAEVALIRDEDGLVYQAVSTEVPGVSTFELPPGIYVPTSAYASDWLEVDPNPIDVQPGRRMRVTVRVEPSRAALRVVGEIPTGAVARVAAEGTAGLTLEELAADSAFGETASTGVSTVMPAVRRTGPVVLTVEWLGRTWFFPAGPEQGGKRDVRVDLPSPHHVILKGERPGVLSLLHDGVACEFAEVDDGLLTFASGDLVVRIDSGESRASIPVSLPAEAGTVVELTVPAEREARTLNVLPPGDLDGRMTVIVTEDDGTGSEHRALVDGPYARAVSGPAWVRAERADHVVWQRHVDGPGDVRVAWGDAALALHVVDDGGDHVEAMLLVDGRMVTPRPPDEFSVLRVLGLQPGPHTVLVLPRDDAFLAKEMRVVLDAGETRRRRVKLTLR